MKPKFEIAQLVQIEFTGELEGEAVKVSKRVYIRGIRWGKTGNNLGWRFLYSLSEHALPTYPQDNLGKTWEEVEEYRLSAVEPVVEAIAKAAA